MRTLTKKIRKHSKKRAAQMREYADLRDIFLTLHPICQRCNFYRSEALHHKKGRIGENLVDVNYFMAVCNDCHDYIHAHPAESYEKGWMLKRSV